MDDLVTSRFSCQTQPPSRPANSQGFTASLTDVT